MNYNWFITVNYEQGGGDMSNPPQEVIDAFDYIAFKTTTYLGLMENMADQLDFTF
jgi:hypothetical protein